MSMSRRKGLAVVVGTFCLLVQASLPVQGHQAWVLPNFFETTQAPVWLSFDATWGDDLFAAGHSGSGLNDLRVIGPSNRDIALANEFVGETKVIGEVELNVEGTYRIEASSPATYWTRVASAEGEKWYRKSKDQVQGEKITRADLYWSKAVVFVTVGARSAVMMRSEKDPLELELLHHPSDLTVGKTIQMRVLSKGKVVANQAIRVYVEGTHGHEPKFVRNSDQEGVCALRLNHPGRYLLVVQQDRAAVDDPKTDTHSLNFYLLINVKSAELKVRD